MIEHITKDMVKEIVEMEMTVATRNMESLKHCNSVSHILSSMYGHDVSFKSLEKKSDQFRRFESMGEVGWWVESNKWEYAKRGGV